MACASAGANKDQSSPEGKNETHDFDDFDFVMLTGVGSLEAHKRINSSTGDKNHETTINNPSSHYSDHDGTYQCCYRGSLPNAG
jgi:hypothetical protein